MDSNLGSNVIPRWPDVGLNIAGARFACLNIRVVVCTLTFARARACVCVCVVLCVCVAGKVRISQLH